MLRRTSVAGYHFYVGFNRYALPGDPRVTKAEVDSWKFETKSRSQWDYQGINERVTAASEFGNMRARPDFEGPRADNSTLHAASLRSDQPHFKKLHEHFDEYCQPGTNKKVAAALAIKEFWDADNFYYPGETYRRNRPSFRSVPAELLNKQSWYHWSDCYLKWHEISATSRSRQFTSPMWPPPGYKKPIFQTKREFVFGVEEPGLMSEVERWSWARAWHEANNRMGPWEIIAWGITLLVMYHMMREMGCNQKWKSMHANQYYPGRQFIRSWGEPKDWDKENWWWQEPLETFPNQGEVWYFTNQRFKYINHLKKVAEEERLARELAAE